jgi:predicted ATPase
VYSHVERAARLEPALRSKSNNRAHNCAKRTIRRLQLNGEQYAINKMFR